MTDVGDIKDEIRRIVAVMSKDFKDNIIPLLPVDEQKYYHKVTFFWGNPLEIIDKLSSYTKHEELQKEMFPFVGLYNDISISRGKYGDYDGTTLELIICNATDPNFDSETRELKNFRPILRKLYAKFFKELSNSPMFDITDAKVDMKHEATERYFWGKQGLYGSDGSLFNDYLDAIHVRRLELRLPNIIC